MAKTDEFKALEQENERLKAELKSARAKYDLYKVYAEDKVKNQAEQIKDFFKAFGLAKSMILAGENMTPEAEKVFEQALK